MYEFPIEFALLLCVMVTVCGGKTSRNDQLPRFVRPSALCVTVK